MITSDESADTLWAVAADHPIRLAPPTKPIAYGDFELTSVAPRGELVWTDWVDCAHPGTMGCVDERVLDSSGHTLVDYRGGGTLLALSPSRLAHVSQLGLVEALDAHGKAVAGRYRYAPDGTPPGFTEVVGLDDAHLAVLSEEPDGGRFDLDLVSVTDRVALVSRQRVAACRRRRPADPTST